MSKDAEPLISVIVPVYNVRQFLERAVASVQHQTYHNLEIILVDDGSTDGSGGLCEQLAQQDARIQVVRQSNQGLSAARNAGIREAHGKYLTFVDSDDEILPDLITVLYDLIVKYKTKMSICSFAEVWSDAKHRDFGGGRSEQHFSQTECLVAMLNEQGFTLMACGKLYARELFNQVTFPEGKLYEDVGTTYRLVMQCAQIPVSYAAKYLYYQHADSIIHQKFTQRNFDLINLTDQMCDDIAQHYGKDMSETLAETLKLRRMHARFSILRMILSDKQFSAQRQEIVRYLKKHRDDVLKNPVATKRDRLAMRSLLIGQWCFNLAWKIYTKLKS